MRETQLSIFYFEDGKVLRDKELRQHPKAEKYKKINCVHIGINDGAPKDMSMYNPCTNV